MNQPEEKKSLSTPESLTVNPHSKDLKNGLMGELVGFDTETPITLSEILLAFQNGKITIQNASDSIEKRQQRIIESEKAKERERVRKLLEQAQADLALVKVQFDRVNISLDTPKDEKIYWQDLYANQSNYVRGITEVLSLLAQESHE